MNIKQLEERTNAAYLNWRYWSNYTGPSGEAYPRQIIEAREQWSGLEAELSKAK